MSAKLFPYKGVFDGVESRLMRLGSANKPEAEVRAELDKFKSFGGRTLTDDDYFSILVFVAFYSGFKAATVTAKRCVIKAHFPDWRTVAAYTEADIQRVIDDAKMISREGKIRACVANANVMGALIAQHGSFRQYVDSFAPSESFESLLLLKESLSASFAYLGGVTVYHFMTDIGLPVLKPDRVICRIFTRLGLLENEDQLLKAVLQGRKFAEATGHPIRYIDIVFVAYGQVQSMEFGIEQGICLKAPRCGECGVKRYCNYAKSSAIGA